MKSTPLISRASAAWFLATALLASTTGAAGAADRIRIVTSINDLGSIASAVGGNQVEVASLCRAGADPHRVEVLPSYMVKVSRAKLYLKVGLGLDVWADAIVEGSHSSSVIVIDCSQGIPVLEKPAGKVDASMGDIHPDGNPHYWLDPANGALVAGTIAEALARVDPPNAADYRSRAGVLAREARAMAEKGRALSLPTKGIITYHRSWTYFAEALGLEVLTTIEPIPGIPPTARHLKEVVAIIRERRPVAIFQEPYFSGEAGKFLNRETGTRLATVSPSCDDVTPGSYLAHFESLFRELGAGGSSGNTRPAGL